MEEAVYLITSKGKEKKLFLLNQVYLMRKKGGQRANIFISELDTGRQSAFSHKFILYPKF